MRVHRESGGIVVLSSQWPEHARRLADRALVLHEGQLVWEAEPTEPVPTEYVEAADAQLRPVLQGLNPQA
jgi:ABC-type multidrug transport system ATPase subunit